MEFELEVIALNPYIQYCDSDVMWLVQMEWTWMPFTPLKKLV